MLFVIPPAGFSAASLFSPTPFADPARAPGILADAIDAKSGDVATLFAGEDPTDAAIKWQFRVRRDSGAAVLGQGQDFGAVTKNDEGSAERLRFEAESVMAPFVARGEISDVRVEVSTEETGDMGAVFVTYKNLRTGERAERVRVR